MGVACCAGISSRVEVYTLIVSSTIISRSSSHTTAAKVQEAVSRVLTSDEQSLRSIREATAKELSVDPSTLTSPVARALSKLVGQGSVERPRRGFYRAIQAEIPEPKVASESTKVSEIKEIGRKLEPKAFVPAPAKPIEPVSYEAPAIDRPEPTLESEPEPVVEPEFVVESEPEADSKPAVVAELAAAPEPVVEPVAVLEPVLVTEPEPLVAEPELVVEPQPVEALSVSEPAIEEPIIQPPTAQPRGLRGKIRSRRDRRWTPEGSMGMQGMIMIILWFVVAGVAIFVLNNVYGILTAVGLAIVFWLFHIAMKPRAKKSRVDANSLPSHP